MNEERIDVELPEPTPAARHALRAPTSPPSRSLRSERSRSSTTRLLREARRGRLLAAPPEDAGRGRHRAAALGARETWLAGAAARGRRAMR